jgi:hypothetical protein
MLICALSFNRLGVRLELWHPSDILFFLHKFKGSMMKRLWHLFMVCPHAVNVWQHNGFWGGVETIFCRLRTSQIFSTVLLQCCQIINAASGACYCGIYGTVTTRIYGNKPQKMVQSSVTGLANFCSSGMYQTSQQNGQTMAVYSQFSLSGQSLQQVHSSAA